MAERTDKYAADKSKLRTATKAKAMAKLWEMAREALATRANLGVKELHYSTDLVEGTEVVKITADERTVRVEVLLDGTGWVAPGEGHVDNPRIVYVLDEAWLLGVARPATEESF